MLGANTLYVDKWKWLNVEGDWWLYRNRKAIGTPELKAIHPQGAEWDLEDAAEGVAIPFHPGAAKYLKEKGILKK